jgi:hypothetical protein
MKAEVGISPQRIPLSLGQTSMSAILGYAHLSNQSMPEVQKAAAAKMKELMNSAKKRIKKQNRVAVINRKSA